ncbi:MAG: DUF1800 family protein [Bacteroidia bacterium]|nr:DUF1800 family protein [Bacteroidia bacterium]
MASLNPRSGTLGRRLAAHLLRRATFGASRAEIEAFAALTADQAVSQLMNFPPLPDHPADPQTGMTWVIAGRNAANSSNQDLKQIVNAWWLYHVMKPGQPLSISHKLTFFLHTSFVTSLDVIDFSENHYYTLRLLMLYAERSYKELALKICLDNGMNDFLDIGDSEKMAPNENFVREFLELFTIGKGPGAGPGDYTTFTEQDVVEGARLMTGFRRNDDWDDPAGWDPDTGLPRATPDPGRHDETDKLFSPRFQNQVITGRADAIGMMQEIQDFVDMIFAQEATARQIVRRLYRFFVRYDIVQEVEDDIIGPLANTLMGNGYMIQPVLATLLQSQHFYDEDDSAANDEIIGALIKSPLELQTQMIRYFGLPVPDPAADAFASYVTFFQFGLMRLMSDACFDLFEPPEVAGYQPIYQAPEYNRLWISAKSLPSRYAMVDAHLEGPPELAFDVMAFVNDPVNVPPFSGSDAYGVPGPHPGPRIASHLVQELVACLLPEAIEPDRFNYFLNEVLLDTLSPINWQMEWDMYLGSGDATNVRAQISALIRAILQSPEFQLG